MKALLHFTFCLFLVGHAPLSAFPQSRDNDHPELLVQTGASELTAMGRIALSPDGHWYATGASDGLQLWSVDLKLQIGHLTRPEQSPLYAIAADSRTIVTPGATNYNAPGMLTPLIQVDAITGQELRRFDAPGPLTSIAASPTEMVVAALVGSNNRVDVRSLADGSSVFSDTAAAKAPSMYGIVMSSVFFSPDGTIVFLSNPEQLVGWEWHTGRRVVDLDASVTYSQNLNRQVAVNYSDGKRVSTAGDEKYNLFTSVGLSRDGRELIACSHDELTFFDLDDEGKYFHQRGVTVSDAGRVYLVCGFFPGRKFYTSTMSATNGTDRKTLLYAEGGKEATPIKAWVQSVLPIPRQDLSLVQTSSTAPLLVSEDAAVQNATLSPPAPATLPTFTVDSRKLWWGAGHSHPLVWDLGAGDARPLSSLEVKNYVAALSGDGLRLAYNDPHTVGLTEQLDIADASTSKVLAHFQAYAQYISFAPSLNEKGSEIALIGDDAKLHVYKVADSSNLLTLTLTHDELQNVHACLSPDGGLIAVAVPNDVSIYSIPTGKKVTSFAYDGKIPVNIYSQFSPDGTTLAIVRSGDHLRLVSTKDWKKEWHLSTVFGEHVAFSSDGRKIVYEATASVNPEEDRPGDNLGGGTLVMDQIETGKHLFQRPGFYASWTLTPDGRFLVAQGLTGAEFIEISTAKLLATMYIFGGEPVYDWLVVTPDGVFDGSPAAWSRVSWRMSHNSFEVAPVELFFREFYHPALLADLIAGKQIIVPADIATLDRRQPSIALHVDGSLENVAAKQVRVRLTVAESRAPLAGREGGSGVRDVRLFRDGTLVKAWRGNLTLDKRGSISLEADIPIVGGENRFTAYAFNAANIKSNDAVLVLTGADSLQRKGTAYVLAIGINRYAANRQDMPLNLNYAEADAADFSTGFAASQKTVGEFDRVETVQLLSEDATRENLIAAFHLLAGASKAGLTSQQQKLFATFRPVLPEDGVFLFYAGHGEAVGNHFYLLPHDFDPLHAEEGAPAHSVSEEDLSKLLEDISPARAFLIIDACNSGKALETNAAVGPMNSVGLAQLAYEKGIYILAASQGIESALEGAQLAGGHGYLTYALMEDGLKKMGAAQNGVVQLRPWFEYANDRVPELQTALLKAEPAGGRGITLVDRPASASQPAVRVRQHPRVFYRREPEATPFTVAQTPTP